MRSIGPKISKVTSGTDFPTSPEDGDIFTVTKLGWGGTFAYNASIKKWLNVDRDSITLDARHVQPAAASTPGQVWIWNGSIPMLTGKYQGAYFHGIDGMFISSTAMNTTNYYSIQSITGLGTGVNSQIQFGNYGFNFSGVTNTQNAAANVFFAMPINIDPITIMGVPTRNLKAVHNNIQVVMVQNGTTTGTFWYWPTALYQLIGLPQRWKDTFDRADNASSPGTADSTQDYHASVGTFGIQSNKLYCPSDATGDLLWVETGISDIYFTCDVTGDYLNSSRRRYFCPMFKMLSPLDYMYLVTENNTLQLWKREAGVFSLFPSGSFACTFTPGQTYTILTLTGGGFISVWVNGVNIISGYNYAATAPRFNSPFATRAGFMFTKTGTPAFNATVDNVAYVLNG